MKTIVRAYTPKDRDAWNSTNCSAVNGHFLFNRSFMEYHAKRFSDASLILEENGVVVGILPANRVIDVIHSHQGLTFGGLVLLDPSTPTAMRQMDAVAAYLADEGAQTIVYKAVPAIYQRRPACADLYWLFRQNARLVRRDVSTTIDYRTLGNYTSRRRRGVKKAFNAGLCFQQSSEIERFWDLLASVLHARHGVLPVHTKEELTILASLHPQQIRLFTATLDGETLAGVLIFEHELVAHAQYIAVSEPGRCLGALDGLFDFLISRYSDQKRYFDFGISTEDCGRSLNIGLVTQKEEFGGSASLHDTYELNLSHVVRNVPN